MVILVLLGPTSHLYSMFYRVIFLSILIAVLKCLVVSSNHVHVFSPQLLANQHTQISMSAMNTVADVLNKLLLVGITDSGAVLFRTKFIKLIETREQ